MPLTLIPHRRESSDGSRRPRQSPAWRSLLALHRPLPRKHWRQYLHIREDDQQPELVLASLIGSVEQILD